jgi:DNA-binding NarL/FixJ family response regulator
VRTLYRSIAWQLMPLWETLHERYHGGRGQDCFAGTVAKGNERQAVPIKKQTEGQYLGITLRCSRIAVFSRFFVAPNQILMVSKTINLAIVDDHALFRKTLRDFLSGQQELNVLMQSSNIFDTVSRLRDLSVDVLLMDIFMPDINGIEGVKMIRTEYPMTRILVLSMSSDIAIVRATLDLGVYGYLSKTVEPDELLQAIYAVADNRLYRNRLLTEALYWSQQEDMRSSTEDISSRLTEREKKILQLIWEEKSNKVIADQLFLGVRSIEKIRQDLKEKLGVGSTVGLLKYAISKRIIQSKCSLPVFDPES